MDPPIVVVFHIYILPVRGVHQCLVRFVSRGSFTDEGSSSVPMRSLLCFGSLMVTVFIRRESFYNKHPFYILVDHCETLILGNGPPRRRCGIIDL